MAKFVIIHGSFITGRQSIGFGGELDLSPEEKAHLDPDGNKLVTPEVFAAMQKKADAEAVIKAPEPKAKAPEAKPEPKPASTKGAAK